MSLLGDGQHGSNDSVRENLWAGGQELAPDLLCDLIGLQFSISTWRGLGSDALVPPQVKAFVTQDIPL